MDVPATRATTCGNARLSSLAPDEFGRRVTETSWLIGDREIVLASRLKLGTYFGIGLYVHWSFALLIGFVIYSTRAAGWLGMAYGVVTLLGVFLCVTLHEYGHALAARRFDVPTLDITLLPIGGVARLQRMPRVPWQELIVAVAGPLVNVAIVVLLMAGLVIYGGSRLIMGAVIDAQTLDHITAMLNSPSLIGFVFYMLLVNTMLVVFNMIPAFPMDGGRVLRSILAMLMSYRRATFVASRVGLVCAVGMAVIALQNSWPMPIVIAAFIGYAGMAEARQVDVMESVRGVSIRNAMIPYPAAVPMNMPLGELARRWHTVPVAAMPVLSAADTVIGMVSLTGLSKALDQGVDPNTPAGQLADHRVEPVRLNDDLEWVVIRAGQKYRQLPVVDHEDRLVGLLDLDSMLSRGRLRSSLHLQDAPRERFSASS